MAPQAVLGSVSALIRRQACEEALWTHPWALDALLRSRVLLRLQDLCRPSMASPFEAVLLTPGIGPPLRPAPGAPRDTPNYKDSCQR